MTGLAPLKPVLEAVQANERLCGRSMIAKILRGSHDKRLIALGLDRSTGYGALAGESIERIGYLVDEALVLFAMERHPGGRELLCLYLWQQRTNRVDEVESTSARRVSDVEAWFRRKLGEYRKKSRFLSSC